MKTILSIIILFFICSCNKPTKTIENSQQQTLFSKLDSQTTGITFSNNVKEDYVNNLLSNFYIYNGAGVAVGDINNDGLDDLYFVSNQNKDQLYLNKGDLMFENITIKSLIKNNDGWSTGVTMADINSDGWLDILVCKSSPAKSKALLKNKIYINQKNNTFKEASDLLGLNNLGFSIQYYFIDFDKDGDLDIYLLDHQMQNVVFSENVSQAVKEQYIGKSNQLYRNDNGKYVNITNSAFKEHNIYPSLSATIGDFNNDGWPDIYVCNDFLLPDELFINNQDGSFSNQILDKMNHISSNSMGSDYADINNDLLPDLLVLDMLAEDHIRSKENMTSMNTKLFDSIIDIGYHKQYMSNVLQLNNGDGTFSEIGQLAGLNKTDWSWGPLVVDFDNDGYKDVLITNGIERDIDNRDFRNKYQKYLDTKTQLSLDQFHALIPSVKQQNYIFKNNADLTFTNKSNSWGLTDFVNSNGAVYSDLDNDGDLDLILNNINDKASVYRNNATSNYIKIKLIGDSKNTLGIGAKVMVYTNGKQQYQELYASRGFQSSVSTTLNFGLGKESKIDSIKVQWTDEKKNTLTNLKPNSLVKIAYKDSKPKKEEVLIALKSKDLFEETRSLINGKPFTHKENGFDDYSLQLLLPQKQSTKGGSISIADVNSDGLEDFYVGNASGTPGALYIQNTEGKFDVTNTSLWQADRSYEDLDVHFFDADADNDLDLYVASGGYELKETSKLLQDRLYINDGHGHFSKGKLPKMLSNTKVIKSNDFDNDGDLDLFIGGNVKPGQYPKASPSYLLKNDNGEFKAVILSKDLELGIVNDALFSDYDEDGDADLIIVGEWMNITVLNNENGVFTKNKETNLEKTSGWWNTIKEIDIDGDGDKDYVLGNLGENNKFKPSEKKPLHIYAGDFDGNGQFDTALSKAYKGMLVPTRGKECSSQQTPFLNEKIKTFSAFANSSITDIYGEETIKNALHLEVYNFNTSILINQGDGTFQIKPLPMATQIAPTMDFEVVDLNNDGLKDFIGVGNLYDAEVETISYDAGRGFIVLNNMDTLSNKDVIRLNLNTDAREIASIMVKDQQCFVVLSNNSELKFYKVNTL